MNYENLEFRRSEHIAWITLARPKALNTLSVRLLEELATILEDIKTDGETRVVVITGKGRAFCAGADLKDVRQQDSAANPTAFLEQVQRTLAGIRALPMPVIAALNGATMGGGLELAMHCDIVVAIETARIADAHANVGVIPGAGGCALLPRLIGPQLAKYMLFTGGSLSAAQLHRAGLISQIFAPDEFMTGVESLAKQIANRSPLGLQWMKRLVHECLKKPHVEDALWLEIMANREYSQSHDMQEGVAAFVARRPAKFLGR